MMRRLSLLISIVLLAVSCRQIDHARFVIGFSQCTDDDWRLVMNDAMMKEASLYDNIDLIIKSAGGDSEQQARDIDEFVRQGVDVLVVAPNEAAPITPVVERAFESGIPLIIADRKVLTEKYSAFIGADNYQIGKSIGLYISNLIPHGGNVVEIAGLMGSSAAQERHSGVVSVLRENPAIRMICSRDAHWVQSDAYEQMLDILSQHKDIDVVFAHNDDMAYGAYMAAKSLGLEKRLSFIGIDALPGPEGGVSLVRKGILSATFIYPSGGDKIIQLAVKIIKGEMYPRSTTMGTAIIDKSNAEVMQLQEKLIADQEEKLAELNERFGNLSMDYSRQRLILYVSFSVILIALVLLAVLLLLFRQRNDLNRKLQQMSCRLEEATQAKLTFFTNVSHELKTPLTLISDPLTQLLQSENLNDNQKFLLTTARDNSDILKQLVNQLLDFRKYESGMDALELSRVDMSDSVQLWNNSFSPAISAKHIKFHCQIQPGRSYVIAADYGKIERVYYNILSNALKFTPENGTITVGLDTDDGGNVVVSIHNTGSYIPEERLGQIFERFYTSDAINAGTGIGLTLANAFVQMHSGKISVRSDRKTGTCFEFSLPVGNVDEIILDDRKAGEEGYVANHVSHIEIEDEVVSNEYKHSVLVIDDNEAIRAYIRKILSTDFFVIEAGDGHEGFRKALQYIPNIIISDVMMPRMDGLECCRKLKNEVSTCHIPVILLTAYDLEEHRVDGYNVGADSYIAKPFSSDVLISRIHNLLESRVRIRTGSDDILTLQNQKVEDMDREFMSRFKTVIDNHLSDVEMTVDLISEELNMSRVQLYRKVKMLTNYSPNEYVRVRRLRKAQKLMLTTDLTIAQICYETGFSSPSYFTKCFKEYYNELPSDYIKRNNNQYRI